MSADADLVERYPALAALPRDLHEEIRASVRYATVAPGGVLFEERHECHGFPMVLSGTVRVSKPAANGRELALYRVAPGDSCVISTGCLMGRSPYAARGVAESEVRLAMLPPALFDRLVERHEPFRRYVFALFSARIAGLMQLVEEVAFRRLDTRLAALLVDRPSPLRVTHQALADELGSVREIVSRLLRGFEEEGFVRLSREQVEVTDADSLRAIAGAVEPRSQTPPRRAP